MVQPALPPGRVAELQDDESFDRVVRERVLIEPMTRIQSSNGSNGDPFGATTAMRYVVYLTIAYLVRRGVAKSGSRENDDA